MCSSTLSESRLSSERERAREREREREGERDRAGERETARERESVCEKERERGRERLPCPKAVSVRGAFTNWLDGELSSRGVIKFVSDGGRTID